MDSLRSSIEQALGATHDFERELGGGGMSRTYLATERALNRQVVVKVLAPELLAGIPVERFRREVMTAARPTPAGAPPRTAGSASSTPPGATPGGPWSSSPGSWSSGPTPSPSCSRR